jgi:predicted dehydrogenase
MENKKALRSAVIGLGVIGKVHLSVISDSGNELVCVCDNDESKLSLCPSAKGYTDYKLMLDSEKIDVLHICTPHYLHAEMIAEALKRDINVICEKPVCMKKEEIELVLEAEKASKAQLGVCFQNRYNLVSQKVRELIDSGKTGKILGSSAFVAWQRDQGYYSSGEWRGKWATDGGALMNQCIHGIDLLRWMFGDEVESVYGSVRNQYHPYIEAEDVGVAVVNFKNGATATVEGTVNCVDSLEETLCVFGEDGMVRLGGMSANTVDVWQFKDEESADSDRRFIEEKAPNVYGNGHTSLYLDFIKALKENRAPYVNLQHGKNALEMVLAIYKSSKTGESVKFPLTDFGTEEMM